MFAISIGVVRCGPFTQHQVQLYTVRRSNNRPVWSLVSNLDRPSVSRDGKQQLARKLARKNRVQFIDGLYSGLPIDTTKARV